MGGNHYGTLKLSQSDFMQLAQQLAVRLSIHTQRPWMVSISEWRANDDYYADLVSANYRFWLHAYRDRGNPNDRLEVKGSNPHRERLDKPERDESITITCAIDRGYEVIALDIARRLWPIYQRVYDKGEALHLAHEALQDQRHQTAVHLGSIFHKAINPEWRKVAHGRGEPGFNWGWGHDCYKHRGSVKIDRDGEVTIELGRITPQQAAFILQFLEDQPRPSPSGDK